MLLLGQGVLSIVLLSWSYQREPHPFVAAMRRFSVVTVSTLALLSLAYGGIDTQREEQRERERRELAE